MHFSWNKKGAHMFEVANKTMVSLLMILMLMLMLMKTTTTTAKQTIN